jgi:molybdenum cofactor cytidylyltransferase
MGQSSIPRFSVPCVILAAGLSTRMGRPKALLPLGCGDSFLTRIVRTLQASDIARIAVVVGPRSAEIREALASASLEVQVIENPDPHAGQLSSLIAALSVIEGQNVDGLMVTLVDVPLVSIETVRRVRDAYFRCRAPIVRPVKEGRHGHPVIFDRSVFAELRAADPSAGAKAVVRAHAHEASEVTVEDEGAFLDIDTPEDYRRLIESAR